MVAGDNRMRTNLLRFIEGTSFAFYTLGQSSFFLDGRWRPSRILRQLFVFVVLFLVDELVLQVAFSYDITIIAVYDLPTVVRGLMGRVALPTILDSV